MRLIIIDGYNVLRSTRRYTQKLQDANDFSSDLYNSAREALLGDVASFVPLDDDALIVFDGGGANTSLNHAANIGSKTSSKTSSNVRPNVRPNASSKTSSNARPNASLNTAANTSANSALKTSRIANIEVVFSPRGVSADDIIERRARKAVEAGVEVLVVSSDASIQWTVLGSNVVRMSAAGFVEELERRQSEFEADRRLTSDMIGKTTLGDRLDPETAAKLSKMARKRS
ncbi:MAG: NYN domain-containing protein [Coriobacteriales bacterium]|jgi:predicted RNA-binding protein with PIN domain|nr:NYN domain-containing protein [Coriobacteriales bacterium]